MHAQTHEHDAWKIKKLRNNAFKYKQKSSKAVAKRNAHESEASSKNNKTKVWKTLSLSNIFVSALTTKVHLSDAEAPDLVGEIFKSTDSIDDASKD